MPYPELFIWWAVCITWGIVFLTAVSIYLYGGQIVRMRNLSQNSAKVTRIGRDFIFVWVLLSLLVFYIVTINIGSAPIFAVGNIVVEGLLLIYLFRNRYK